VEDGAATVTLGALNVTAYTNILPQINKRVNVAYSVRQIVGRVNYNNVVGANISYFHVPLITATRTYGFSNRLQQNVYLNGWEPNQYQISVKGIKVAHIVALYGFDFSPASGANYTINYVEGSSHAAGNAATGRNTYNDQDFDDLYLANHLPDGTPSGLIAHFS